MEGQYPGPVSLARVKIGTSLAIGIDRHHRRWIPSPVLVLLVACLCATATGCHQVLATAVFFWTGTDAPAEYAGLAGKRVVVLCRPPSSLEFRDAGAARDLAKRVGRLLATHVEDIDVVDPADVENWADESDSEDFRELAEAVDAEMVVRIELEDFRLHKGQTLYQGRATLSLSVHDMTNKGRIVWDKPVAEILFPENSAVPAQEKALEQFRRQFLNVLGEKIAIHFYDHDPRHLFAIDATAHR